MKSILLLFLMMFPLMSGSGEVKVYKGSSRYSADILFNYSGLLTIEEFVAVWYTVNYVY